MTGTTRLLRATPTDIALRENAPFHVVLVQPVAELEVRFVCPLVEASEQPVAEPEVRFVCPLVEASAEVPSTTEQTDSALRDRRSLVEAFSLLPNVTDQSVLKLAMAKAVTPRACPLPSSAPASTCSASTGRSACPEGGLRALRDFLEDRRLRGFEPRLGLAVLQDFGEGRTHIEGTAGPRLLAMSARKVFVASSSTTKLFASITTPYSCQRSGRAALTGPATYGPGGWFLPMTLWFSTSRFAETSSGSRLTSCFNSKPARPTL